MESHSQSIKDIRKMFWAIVLLILTLLGGVITDIVEKTVTHDRSSLITTDHFNAAR